VTLRDETVADADAIHEVTAAAFKGVAVSRQTEPYIVAALRASGALAVSLVAEAEGRVVGHLAFSPVEISDGARGWYGLGPVSVRPDWQRRGVGKALVREGLARLRALNARGCCLVGHPAYYPQFGFANVAGLGLDGVPPEVFFALAFDGRLPRGAVTFHPAFRAEGPPSPPRP
jgi:putative acetyltransferase